MTNSERGTWGLIISIGILLLAVIMQGVYARQQIEQAQQALDSLATTEAATLPEMLPRLATVEARLEAAEIRLTEVAFVMVEQTPEIPAAEVPEANDAAPLLIGFLIIVAVIGLLLFLEKISNSISFDP